MIAWHPAALEERRQAIAESRFLYGKATARRFADTITRHLSVLSRVPLKAPPIYRLEFRHQQLRPFPFALIVECPQLGALGLQSEPGLRVLALAHHKRRPGYWLDRAR